MLHSSYRYGCAQAITIAMCRRIERLIHQRADQSAGSRAGSGDLWGAGSDASAFYGFAATSINIFTSLDNSGQNTLLFIIVNTFTIMNRQGRSHMRLKDGGGDQTRVQGAG